MARRLEQGLDQDGGPPLVAGRAVRLSPLVRRVLAPNASAYTGPGTNSYLVGHGEVAAIDPGPDDAGDGADHVAALIGALDEGERIVAILCTHTHRDHSPAAAPLRRLTGAPVIGCAPLPLDDRAFDRDYRPDRVLADGETVAGAGWRLAAVATPGHTSNHLCYALAEEEALFSGDHVMGWSTTVVLPPDGDMGDYLRSLERLAGRADRIYYPGHGQPVTDPQRVVRAQAGHRRAREAQILKLIEDVPMTIDGLVAAMYPSLKPALVGGAGRTVLAHLIHLDARAMVWTDGRRWGAC